MTLEMALAWFKLDESQFEFGWGRENDTWLVRIFSRALVNVSDISDHDVSDPNLMPNFAGISTFSEWINETCDDMNITPYRRETESNPKSDPEFDLSGSEDENVDDGADAQNLKEFEPKILPPMPENVLGAGEQNLENSCLSEVKLEDGEDELASLKEASQDQKRRKIE